MSVAMKINEEFNGIELYFNAKPEKEVLSNLKSNGFRWSAFKKCWYTKQSEKAFKVAEGLTNNVVELPQVKQTKKQQLKQTKNLWESTQWNEIQISQETKDKPAKEIAKEIRSHIKKQFPKFKFSVRTDGNSYYESIRITIKSTPYEEGSIYISYIKEYCENLLNAYHHCYDPSDSYSDYAGSYNFYGRVEIDWDYQQTEATEEIKQDMMNFDNKLKEYNMLEEERKRAGFKVWQEQQEKQRQEYDIRQQEEKKQIENIYNSVEVNDLAENKQYFIIGSEFANLNKNGRLDQYKEEVNKGDYTLNNVKVTKEIHFTNKEALANFSDMLLNDFDFLANTGGSFTEDNRINSMTDFYNMDEFERRTVEWNLYGVAIYFNNKLQFVVDAQGHSYARYVGLTDNAKTEKSITVEQVVTEGELTNLKLQADQLEDISTSVISELNIFNTWQKESWNEYKDALKDKLKNNKFEFKKEIIQQLEIEELKGSMYKLLKEVDGIQDQFKEADIQEGEKLTLFYISDWGSMVTNRVTFDSVTNTKYAQYENAVKLTFKPENKRKLHYQYFHSTLLVYKGWHKLPDTVLYHVEENNSFRTTRSKYHSCDNRQYDEIMNHFDSNGVTPIINTYKPQF